jgi:hypothetical protein
MFYLMAEIDGVMVRIGRHTQTENRAIDSAIKNFYTGHCGKPISYVEVWQRGGDGAKFMWSSMLAGL